MATTPWRTPVWRRSRPSSWEGRCPWASTSAGGGTRPIELGDVVGMAAIPSDIRLMLDGALPALDRLKVNCWYDRTWSRPARSAPSRPGIETASAARFLDRFHKHAAGVRDPYRRLPRRHGLASRPHRAWLRLPLLRASADYHRLCCLPGLASPAPIHRRRSDTATSGHNENTPKCLLPAQFSLLARTLY